MGEAPHATHGNLRFLTPPAKKPLIFLLRLFAHVYALMIYHLVDGYNVVDVRYTQTLLFTLWANLTPYIELTNASLALIVDYSAAASPDHQERQPKPDSFIAAYGYTLTHIQSHFIAVP